MPISGGYRARNPAPLAFMLNNRSCETFVSSKPGEPVLLVQHQPNGQVRLVPVTAASNPVPGVSIDPDGGVHFTPVTPAPSTTSAEIGAGEETTDAPSSSASPTNTESHQEPDNLVAPLAPLGGTTTPATAETPLQSPPPSLPSEPECAPACPEGT